ncbi:MAG: hypothetical protein RLY31_1778 [Bacteroidota bacterium]|jgi:hypothetical protein
MMVTRLKKFTRIPRRMVWAFVYEGLETKQMLQTFAHRGFVELRMADPASGPSPAEMERAVRQLRDIPRFLPFFVFVIAPMPGVTEGYVLLAISLEKWLGRKISLLPSHFRKVFQEPEEKEVVS